LAVASRLTVLLHDAGEYVLGEVICPFKAVIGDGYTAVEARLSSAIYLRFGLPAEPSASLKRIMKRSDRRAMLLELPDQSRFTSWTAPGQTESPPIPV
jgi:5'-deoxynucleotidase YfbR-like HD superfamily hydrolase